MRFRSFETALTIIAVASSLLFAQQNAKTVSSTDFLPMVGSWSGKLTYLDYGDDSTRVTLDVMLDVAETDSGLATRTTFVEPNGEEYESTGLLGVSHGGRRVLMDGKAWMLYDAKTTQNGTTVVFQGPGEDNDRKAQITNILFMSTPGVMAQDSAVLTKKVLYIGRGHEIQRHQYRLGRVSQ